MNSEIKITEKILAKYKSLFPNQRVGTNDFSYYAWPETFGSTCGPHHGIGGDMMTNFTVEAYHCEDYNTTIYICTDMYMAAKGGFRPFELPGRNWSNL